MNRHTCHLQAPTTSCYNETTVNCKPSQ